MALSDILNNIFNKNKKAQTATQQPTEQTKTQQPNTKTLQDIIFDQCRENVNPNYIQEHAEEIEEKMLNHFYGNTNFAFYEEVSTTNFEDAYPSRIARELNEELLEKVTKTLQQYFPMEIFGKNIERFYYSSLEELLYTAQEQSHEVDFGQVCDKIKKLVFETQFFENKFIQQASHNNFDIGLFDTEMSADEFEHFRAKKYSLEEMNKLPDVVINKLNKSIEQLTYENTTLQAKLQEAIEHKTKLEEEKVNLFKDRKKLREQMKEASTDDLQRQFEDSLEAEKNYTEMIRQAKQPVEDIRAEIEDNNRSIDKKKADIMKYTQMQQYLARSRDGMGQI
ncbi:MAG: hypothetical protein E7345_03350 [Clostridiales bacterium]|nr:hypothetical protein [Clostridiales bacterium]